MANRLVNMMSTFREVVRNLQGRQSNQVKQGICTTTFSAPPRKLLRAKISFIHGTNPEILFPIPF